MALYDRIKFTPSGTPGTGTITVGSAASGFRTPATASVADGTQLIAYAIEDGTAWETGTGTYTSSGTTFSRTLSASSTGSLLSLSSSATIYFTPIATSLVQDIDNRLWGFQDSDFHIATVSATNGPFVGAAVSSGTTAATPTTSTNHPGIVRVSASVTANSGWRATASDRILIGGGEIFDAVLKPLTDMSTLTMRCGYIDTTTVADNTDGVYFEQVGNGFVVGRTASNGGANRTTSSTIATIATDTWYHFRITVNNDATSVKFEIFSDAGALLGTQSITTNIPTGAGRDTAVGFIVTSTIGSATAIYDVDYMRFGSTRKLVRGAL
jgi:hypothetical protein